MDLRKCTLPAGLRHDLGYWYVSSLRVQCEVPVGGTCVYRDTLVPSYFLVRYAGTCMFAWLEWGRWPGARFPLPKTWGFLVFGQLQRRQPASLPLPSVSQSVPTLAGKPWGLRLFRYGETNPARPSSFIHLILPSLPSHNLAESGTVLGHWKTARV